MTDHKLAITEIGADFTGKSFFSERVFERTDRGGMLLTEQLDAVNFRIRESMPGYSADFHMAGDPTLISVLAGTLRVTLQNGQHRDFGAGDMFIAADNLPAGMDFDNRRHGHKAEVVGDGVFRAVHIKLAVYGKKSV